MLSRPSRSPALIIKGSVRRDCAAGVAQAGERVLFLRKYLQSDQ